MLSKLTLRNVKRSSKDYIIYIVTMAIVASLMFAFNGMMFSQDMKDLYQEFGIFIAFVGLASFFIIIIVIWLIHYMVNFMMEKRSREFGTYLLLGMNKKQIASIFLRENMILGFISLLAGVIPGMFFQIAFTNIFYSIVNAEYHISPDFSPWNLLLTFGLFFSAYVLALFRVKRKFKKMTIKSLISMDKHNELVKNEKSTWKKLLVFISVAYIILFNVLALTSNMSLGSVWLYIAGLVAAIYLLYIGLSSFFLSYIKKQHKGIYKEANIFVFRQLSSKIKTMRFTMGTLTILFTTALLAWMVVMMFTDYQNKELGKSLAFDVLVFNEDTNYDFRDELNIISEDSAIEDQHSYNIYENGTDHINQYLYEHVDGTWRNDLGSSYFRYDTYIGISDYNYIRSMLGYETVDLGDHGYLIHSIERVRPYLEQLAASGSVIDNNALIYKGLFSDPLTQNGMNGADYLIVVPDPYLKSMDPYYSLLAVSIKDQAPAGLSERLSSIRPSFLSEIGGFNSTFQHGQGSNNIISYSSLVLVRDNDIVEVGLALVSIAFVLAYVGIVFLCAALTILAVQQLSDSSKYKFRYSILKQLGLSRKETDRVVLKQLGVYYLCPFVISIVLSMFIGLFASERFVYYTGIQAGIFWYYLLAVFVFAVLYAVYFIVTYVGFLRNIYH
ncbi:ABC transporter permease [Paenibacillus motobuensis]|uniref:ABC transporter permease n=1 Tax=Paenibacillus TaxID=44249 RepID=UPI0020424DF8|nr:MULTISPECIES: ABC transporter permease [Paenibacillus]MCM3039315.1 ABC transporter permease [Paenibacillus lutimineralis]MCM3646419.1 ABC transporter permease [Paenibacillus motobuensis]